MADDSTKQKLQQAKELIKTKRYTEARHILEPMNHPTAEKWLTDLERIDPTWVDEVPEPDWDLPNSSPQSVEVRRPSKSISSEDVTKKQYIGLVDAFRMSGVLLIVVAGLAGVIVGLSRNGGIIGGLAVALAILLSAMILNAIAAAIDLLSTIEVNTRKMAAMLESQSAPPDKRSTGIHPLTRSQE